MKSLTQHIYIATLLGLIGFVGCTGSVESSESMRAMADVIDVEFDLNSNGDTPDNGVLDDYFIDGRSVIIISQRGNSLSIDFNDYKTDGEGNRTENENLYKYVYYSNPLATWEQSYNFQPYGNRALDWTYMNNNRLNGEYTLGALYYPVEYNVYNSVETDQSKYENILRSNVLGAWHRTNQYHDRLKFRFSHLMEAIRVTLLIPDWNPEDNSGFGADAVESGVLLSVIKDFVIDWPANLATEYFPNATLSEGSVPCDINMYPESVCNEVKTVNFHDITSSFPDQEENVRTATFVVLFPPQQPANTAMRFVLKTMGGQEKSYVWNINDMYDSSMPSEGSRVNNITLYLPRKGNNAILISAHIMSWIDAESQFTVIPDDID